MKDHMPPFLIESHRIPVGGQLRHFYILPHEDILGLKKEVTLYGRFEVDQRLLRSSILHFELLGLEYLFAWEIFRRLWL